MPGLGKHCELLPAIVFIAGLLFASATAHSAGAGSVDINPVVSGPLDGMTFVGALGPDGKPKDTPDSFVFENGTFVSKECELRCKYPARPYFVRINGSKTEFISETQCPYKDARIIWRGTVDGNTIKGQSTWVAKRWYWTVESNFEFEGKLVSGTAAPAVIE